MLIIVGTVHYKPIGLGHRPIEEGSIAYKKAYYIYTSLLAKSFFLSKNKPF